MRKKETSKSHSLKRRLMIMMIACLLTVMIICTVVFELVYSRTVVTVDNHFTRLTDLMYENMTTTVFAEDIECMKAVLQCYCREMGSELKQGVVGTHKEELKQYLMYRASDYFYDIMVPHEVFFIADKDDIRALNLYTSEADDSLMHKAFEAIDRNDIDDGYDEMPFEEYFLNNQDHFDGRYTGYGEGYVVIWDNLSGYSDRDLCVGLLSRGQNNWQGQMKEGTDYEVGILNDSMDTLFKKYALVMLVSVGGVLAVFIIISAVLSKKLADPVVSEHDMLVEINEMKTTFLSDASHELKTPLAAMSGYAQTAEAELAGGNTEPVREKLKRISSEANRMALMVTQILDATRIEEGRLVLEPSPCDLDKLVRETVETYFAVLNKNNNRLALRIPLDLPEAYADSGRMQRVFVNLISNALKHTHNGTILIKAEQENGEIKVTVKDTGSGISEEDLPHIWERYYKGKHSETGTGLGLFICKFIIESHGGRIWVESEAGKGTAFMFTLPVKE